MEEVIPVRVKIENGMIDEPEGQSEPHSENDPKVESQYLSVSFKLHKPSKKKQAAILDAMKRSHLAFDKLLKHFRDQVGEISAIDDRKTQKERLKELAKAAAAVVRPLPLGSGPKQAVQTDFISQIESYLALKKADEKTQYPTCQKLRSEKSRYDAALEALATSTTKEEEESARDELARVRSDGQLRPLNILKNRPTDGALLLQDEKGRLLVYVNLLPAKNRHGLKVDLSGLIDTRNGEVQPSKRPYRNGVLLPLEAGRWQIENFIKKGRLQSSRLVHRNGEFFFIGTFLLEAEKVEPKNLMGIKRGVGNLVAYVVVNPRGEVLTQGAVSGLELKLVQQEEEKRQKAEQAKGRNYTRRRRAHENDAQCYHAANWVADIAERYDARVVMDDLKSVMNGPQKRRPKGQVRNYMNFMLSRFQFGKMAEILNQRLALIGHTQVNRKGRFYSVSAAYTSSTCPLCGHNAKENRKGPYEFLCVSCHFAAPSDLVGALNIAHKGRHLQAVVVNMKKGQKMTEDQKFDAWYAADLTTRNNRKVALSITPQKDDSSPAYGPGRSDNNVLTRTRKGGSNRLRIAKH